MDLKKPLLHVVKNTVKIQIDLKGLSHGLIDEVLEPALKEVVADTTNPVDDMVVAMILPPLDAQLKKLIDAKLDEVQKQLDAELAKILG